MLWTLWTKTHKKHIKYPIQKQTDNFAFPSSESRTLKMMKWMVCVWCECSEQCGGCFSSVTVDELWGCSSYVERVNETDDVTCELNTLDDGGCFSSATVGGLMMLQLSPQLLSNQLISWWLSYRFRTSWPVAYLTWIDMNGERWNCVQAVTVGIILFFIFLTTLHNKRWTLWMSSLDTVNLCSIPVATLKILKSW